ncbi:hypothetical protein AB0E88_30965 [Streptomyces sp. NPDC028635]|uniref:DUF7336 domain-containing protein n=1 Tax=Streptomyces sp. NPDC028635 TaxID=3154800 RepID=UPI0033E60C47
MADETGEVLHFRGPDDNWCNEEVDDRKDLGTYTSREKALHRIERARQLPGFADEPDCFHIEEITVDEDDRRDGDHTTLPSGDVYEVWHVRHRAEEDGELRHFQDLDDFWCDEEFDDVRLLGVYSTKEKAQARVERSRPLPEYADEPNCFSVIEVTLDDGDWTDGFVTVWS